MCAKVAQNHETKKQKAKNPSKVLLSRIYYVPFPPTKSHSCVPLVASERSSSGNRLVAQRRVVLQYAYRGRIRKSEGFKIVTSKIALSPKPPINKDGLRFLPKLAHFSNEREKVSVNDSKEKSQRKIMSGSLIRGQK